MKKLLLLAALGCAAASVSAQDLALAPAKLSDNWSIGLDGGVATPMNHGAFFGDMRGIAGLHIAKQITPTFGMGVEGIWGVNTSSWKGQTHSTTAFDSQYVGLYGTVNLFTLFGGYQAEKLPVNLEVQAGAGWGHLFENEPVADHNFFATKVGANLNIKASDRVTVSLKPSFLFDMSDAHTSMSTAAYNRNKATFNLMAGVSVRLGNGFQWVPVYNAAEVAELNGRINDLRAQLDGCTNNNAALDARNRALAAELKACQEKAPEVVKVDNNQLYSVRYVNFRIGKTNITNDQMPNVEAVADFLKNHKNSTVLIKGYASQDGPLELNERLARERAESVKATLVKKFGIAADRIQAEGEGIGHMFSEESWNRVAICTVDEK